MGKNREQELERQAAKEQVKVMLSARQSKKDEHAQKCYDAREKLKALRNR